MANSFIFPGYQLPINLEQSGGRMTEGFLTPSQDLMPQVFSIPPRRVLPIIFIPGIMGSNLRMSAKRQGFMKKTNNLAWRPDNKTESIAFAKASPATRQNQLDPSTTEVDEYDPVHNPTGDAKETADERNEKVAVSFTYPLGVSITTPLLMDDPVASTSSKTKDQKARERGWGEVLFGSYQQVLEMCEQRLNSAFFFGQLDSWWRENIVDVAPATWQASAQPALHPLDEKTLRQAVKGCWFPAHAMGYNWLQSNQKSGIDMAERITALMTRYQAQGFQCEKVILVTHSMGGLVARAVIHPKMGNLNDKVLGIVHGVMPAIGAAAAYKRMRCGFEDPGLLSTSFKESIAAKVVGNEGPEVTAVLANAQGGLELLPSQAYGNDWLQAMDEGIVMQSWPKKGDPYEEIYKVRGKWYGLLREEWINPARKTYAGFNKTCMLLDQAKAFHNAIADTYHKQSYGHYGAGREHAAWHRVTWKTCGTKSCFSWVNADNFEIKEDNFKGKLRVIDLKRPERANAAQSGFELNLLPASDPGDQTVPLHSAEHQLRSGKFKGIFRQTGYEHQNSYQNEGVLHATLYSLVRIAQTMTWSKP